MSDLIERLRYGHGEQTGITDEAADEIERLQAQIAAMTKDMDSLEKQLDMADAAIERWKAENEELRSGRPIAHIIAKHERHLMAQELAALKSQSAEQPVAWEYRTYNSEKDEVYYHVTQSWLEAKNYDQYPAPLYYIPPAATALVEDFKRRAIEAVENERVDGTGSEEDEAYNAAIFHAVKAIEALPL